MQSVVFVFVRCAGVFFFWNNKFGGGQGEVRHVVVAFGAFFYKKKKFNI